MNDVAEKVKKLSQSNLILMSHRSNQKHLL